MREAISMQLEALHTERWHRAASLRRSQAPR
jgi:hypothetical protein